MLKCILRLYCCWRLLYYFTLWLYFGKECAFPPLDVYDPNLLCIIVHEITFCLSRTLPNSLLTHLLSFCSSSYLLLRHMTMILSPSVPPTVCLNPSLSLSVYRSPSPMQHHSSCKKPFRLHAASLSHSPSRLAITAYLLFSRPLLFPPPCILQGTSDPQCIVWDYGNP